jgi:hypothetical protein
MHACINLKECSKASVDQQSMNCAERVRMARSSDIPKTREGVEAAAVNWTHALMDITVRKSAPRMRSTHMPMHLYKSCIHMHV